MKYKEKLVNLFKNICNTTIKCSIKNRKLSESDYFDACFLLIIQFTILSLS